MYTHTRTYTHRVCIYSNCKFCLLASSEFITCTDAAGSPLTWHRMFPPAEPTFACNLGDDQTLQNSYYSSPSHPLTPDSSILVKGPNTFAGVKLIPRTL